MNQSWEFLDNETGYPVRESGYSKAPKRVEVMDEDGDECDDEPLDEEDAFYMVAQDLREVWDDLTLVATQVQGQDETLTKYLVNAANSLKAAIHQAERRAAPVGGQDPSE